MRIKLMIKERDFLYFGREKIKYKKLKNWNNLSKILKESFKKIFNSDKLEISKDFKNNILITSKNKNKNLLGYIDKNDNIKIMKILNIVEYFNMINYIKSKIKKKVELQYKYNKKIISLLNKPKTRNTLKKINFYTKKYLNITNSKVIKFTKF